jgi:methyl-accepting chemotaxis protein
MALMNQIEEFQSTMNQVLELVEETKALASKIHDMPFEEIPLTMQEIFELCADGIKSLQTATEQVEDIQNIVGG